MRIQGQFTLFDREEFEEWLMKQSFKRKVVLIQNHHTWSPDYKDFNGSNHFQRLDSMKSFHINDRGFSDIAQNLTTFPDGMIAVCRPFDVAPAGIKGANSNGICIEHFGNFDIGGDKMTDEHRKTILFLNAVLCKKFKLSISTESVVYHHWWSTDGDKVFNLKTGEKLKGSPSKTCPGTAFFGGNTVLDAQKNFIPLIATAFNDNGEDEDKLKLTNYQKTQLIEVLKGLLLQGVITDKSWVDKAQNDTLTVSELTWLNMIVIARK
ncbi:hypothetical protein BVG16_13575 [Paenibacillus selenitireducens]|uniref:N-acetylmuramoyl-L-alanine amidase domain-containing protein n=1 Tax=Paenibacillus selenitireducens TaxID=1324314 RepID=A0A1T2XCA7_9BACL|nr:peptidoglycan recognition family protein [Paenibacillus selenitireducens]OPA77480.1 hypothetical protein BVG16_13575 [Paenibacillus selenitireducens]